MAECKVCGGELQLSEDLEVGEIVVCQDCGKDYEVTSVSPVELEFAPEVKEDWGE